MENYYFSFNSNLMVFLLGIFILGCNTEDDDVATEPDKEKTQITMETPGNEDLDWNNVDLVWQEEFNGASTVEDIWDFESKNTTNPDIADQLQVYRKENVQLSDSTLQIYARKQDGIYTAARLTSKYAFKYGRIEISAQLPQKEKKGIWAKLALIGENNEVVGWPACGEIDLMEYFSHLPDQVYMNIHSSANNALNGTLISTTTQLETIEEEFHAFGILWTDKYIKFYIDDPDNVFYTLNKPTPSNSENWPFDEHFYLLSDLVIGGKYGGAEGVDDTLFPARMEIDYIRVYHIK